MAVAFKSASTFTSWAALTIPSLADGDFVIITLSTDSAHAITGSPTGFTHHGTQQDATPDSASSLWTKYIASAASETSWAITNTGSGSGAGQILVYTGAKSTSTVSPAPTSNASGATATPATNSYTPDNADSMVIATYGTDPAGATVSTPTSGFTERNNFANGALGFVYAEEKLQTTAAAVNGVPTFDRSDRYSMWIFAIAPVLAGAVVIPTVNQAPPVPTGPSFPGDHPGRD